MSSSTRVSCPPKKKRRGNDSQSIPVDHDSETYTFSATEVHQLIQRVHIAVLGKYQSDLGLTNQQIANKVGCGIATAKRWKTAEISADALCTNQGHGGGRPRTKTTSHWKDQIDRSRLNAEQFSLRRFESDHKDQDGPSYSSVRRVLKKLKLFPFKKNKVGTINQWQQDARFSWCRVAAGMNLAWYESLCITDSKIFRLDGGRNHQNDRDWLTREERKTADLRYSKDKFPKSVHVYGGMSARGLTKLVVVKGNVNSDMYIRRVLPVILKEPMARRRSTGTAVQRKMFPNPKKFIFEQDHASSHDSNRTQDYVSRTAPDLLDKSQTCSKLDDFWCIERQWGYMTGEVFKSLRPKTVEELTKRIFEVWENTPVDQLRASVHDMRARAAYIVQLDGNKITDRNYQPCGCAFCKTYRKNKKK